LSAIGGFVTWDLSHPMITNAQNMRRAYSELTPAGNQASRESLAGAFNRSAMMVKDATSVLAPQTSCENLRWLSPADTLHSLCFSIHDLTYLDADLPEKDSPKTKMLIKSLAAQTGKSATTEQAIAEKRTHFLRKTNLLSQSEWIVSQEQRLTGYLNSPQPSVPSADPVASVIARLQKEIFDLPASDEFSFMTPVNVDTQDKPIGSNSTLSVVKSGNYSSSRLASPVSNVVVACVRSLRQWDSSTATVKTISELEYRPHSYCPGGSNPQPDHFWYRNYQWGQMIADQTVGAAQDYAQAIRDRLLSNGQPSEWASRISVISNFTIDDRIDFFSEESDDVSPLLTALRVPAQLLSQQLNGWQPFAQTGALLLASNKAEARARFVKGDSGAILLLDGVPFATLYSVDGEQTSGGATIRALPNADSENVDFDPLTSDAASGSRNTVTDNGASNAPKGGKSSIDCLQ
jgi:hypothetical protein